MKVKSLFYIAAFLTANCFTTQAMEDPSKLSPEAFEELNNIVCTGFTLPIYKHNDLLFISEKLPETKHYTGSFEGLTDNFIIVQIMGYLPPKGLLNFGETCTFLHALSLSPCFYLNEYCLQPGILRSIPVNVIRWKTERTKDGILKLAGSYDGIPKNLCQWFEKPELVKVQEACGPFPETIEGLDEKGLERLYSVRQVNAAVAFPNPLQLSTNFHQSVSMIPHTSPLFPHCLRFLGYTPPGAYPVQDLSKSVNQMRNGDEPFNFQLIEVFGHDSILGTHAIWNMNCYFGIFPQKADLAIQVLNWCSKHEVGLTSGSSLIWLAMKLNQPKLAIEIGKKALKLQNNMFHTPFEGDKTSVVMALADTAEFKSDLEAFTRHALEYWQGDHWELPANGHINGYIKKQILRLMLRTGLTENIDDIYANLWNPLQERDPDDELIEDLFTYGKPELGRDMICRLLELENPLMRIYDVVPFLQRVIQTDRTVFLPRLKEKMAEYFSKEAGSLDEQVDFCLGLLSCSPEPEDIDYVTAQLASLSPKLENLTGRNYGIYINLATAHFLLGNKELSTSFYNEWFNHVLTIHPHTQTDLLTWLNECGLAVANLTDLTAMTPDEVISKLWQTIYKKSSTQMFT